IMTSRLRCFFDIKIDGNNVGRIVFELCNDICPRTCENFRCLCTGEKGRVSTSNKRLYYKKCHFHRIVKNFMVQSGYVTEEILGNGTGNESIYGGTFDDENFQIKHDQPYLLSMDNQGPNTNGSQFFITTSEASHLDGKHVVFGHVLSGQSVVDTIYNVAVDSNMRPLQYVIIAHCGQLILDSEKEQKISRKEKKKKKHRRKKKKRLAKISIEEENQTDQLTKTTIEIPDRDVMVPKATIDLDVKSKIPVDRFIIEQNLNEDDDHNNETSDTTATYYLSSKRIDLDGRSVKGRGSVKYTGRSRSRSRTPPQSHSTLKGRHIYKEKDDNNRDDLHSHRHARRRNDHDYPQTESTSQHQSRSASTIQPKENDALTTSRKCLSPSSSSTAPPPTTTNDQHQEKYSRSYRRCHSSSPIDDQLEIDHIQSDQIEDVSTNLVSSSSKKLRKYWGQQEESNLAQSLAPAKQYTRLDNDLRMISQTSAAQLKSTSHHTNILHQSSDQTIVYESKWNDEYNISSKQKANSSHPSDSLTSSSHDSHADQNKKSDTPTIGQIYILRKSVEQVLGCTLKPSLSFLSLNSLSSSSSSLVTSTTKHQKPRPCLVWQTKPNIEVLLITKFDGINIDDSNFECGLLPIGYVRKRLVPIAPKKEFDGKRSITTRATIKNCRNLVANSYLILIPVQVEKYTEWNKLLPQFFDQNDLSYINDLLVNAVTEEIKLQGKARQEEINKLNYNFISYDNRDDNDDDDDNIGDNQTGSSSIPVSRNCKSPNIDSNEKVKIWVKKYFIHNQSVDDDDQPTKLVKDLVGPAQDYLLLSRETLNVQISTINQQNWSKI
ncbi:unnamed protein product, partial [Rotaria magnacalcarata]